MIGIDRLKTKLRAMFDRLRLRTSWKVIVPTLCLSSLLLGIGIVAAWQLDRIQSSTSQVVALNVSSIKAAEELEIALREMRTRLSFFSLTGDRQQLNDLAKYREQVDHWLAESRRLATTEFEQQQIQQVEFDYRRLLDDFDRLHSLAQRSGNDAELEHLARTLALNEMKGMLTAAHEYLDFNENAITESSEHNRRITERLVPTFSLLGICGAVAGVLTGFAIARAVRQRVVECNVPIRDVAGKLNEVVGPVSLTGPLDLDDLEPALRQISDRVQHVVQRLQLSEREVLQSEQLAAVGQLAAGMAHELRNPLASMKVLVQSSLMHDQAHLEGRDLEILEEEIDRMTDLIASFLDYARPPKLEKQTLDLTDSLNQSVALVLPRATQQEVRVHLKLPNRTASLEGDARQLRQVFLNLIENSLDAMPSGGQLWIELQERDAPPPPITTTPWKEVESTEWSCTEADEPPVLSAANRIHSGRCAGNSDASRGFADVPAIQSSGMNIPDSVTDSRISATGLSLHVIDTGCGIRSDLLDRLFQPFVSSKETGLGLGLSICRRIVQLHGGTITGTNLANGGSAFSIWLPTLSKLPDREQIVAPPLLPRPEHETESLPGLTAATPALMVW